VVVEEVRLVRVSQGPGISELIHVDMVLAGVEWTHVDPFMDPV
jgi:hypothetical protein